MKEILIIIAFNLIVFFRTLRFTVITDDIKWYSSHKDGWPPLKAYGWNIHNFISQRLYGGCTFLNIKWHFNTNVEIDHLFSVFLHTTIGCLIYAATGSFWGAILYSCNPMNNQTSIWLNGRRYAINIILVLLSLIAWQHHAWYLAIPLWGYTASFHMTGIFAPLLWNCGWPLLMVIPFVWIYREKIMNQVLARMASIYSKELLIFFPRRIIVVIKSYGFYFWQMLFPTRTLLYYSDLQFWGVTTQGNKDAYSYNKSFYLGCAALLISIYGMLALPSHYRPMAFFAFFALIQWCNIVYAVATLADRYSNMSLVFMMVILSYLINSIPGPLSFLILGLFLGYYLMSLSMTMKMYPVIWDQYKYHIWRCPESLSGRLFYANFHIKKQDFVSAWSIVEEGLKYHPNDFLLLYQAAQCWKGIGNINECKKYLARAGENFYDNQDKIQRQALVDFVL